MKILTTSLLLFLSLSVSAQETKALTQNNTNYIKKMEADTITIDEKQAETTLTGDVLITTKEGEKLKAEKIIVKESDGVTTITSEAHTLTE
ncbi:LptA/OstA family protein [Zooshikella ganghwensis]|uniref:LptA/OstA family protein n=1 Tax=Zooshikella ganghwensis TaxID=202772 RepID=UPI0003FC56BB|nr:LptA/OstA family protein [Zooshikella ganghwensis]